MSEHRIQNEARNALAGKCLAFRANTGRAWTGNDIKWLPDGSILIRDPRPFSTGLPAGFSDVFGLVPVVVTPEMVGDTIGVFHAIEFKSPTGTPTDKQMAFITAVLRNGGRAGIARSTQDAIDIVLGLRNV
jgi:hypothetical protein